MNKAYSRVNWHNEPNITTPLNETNLNKMDSALDTVDTRVVTFDTTKANQSDLLQSLKQVTYNTTTGVFTFTYWNGTTQEVDLNIEKIPVSFSMDANGVITMTTADGTQYTADVSSLIKTYTFSDSTEIDFTTTTDQSGNKTVTAEIKAGSITGNKLQPNYLADCVSAKNDAETAESNAGQSARDSSASSQDSEAWAVGTRNGVPVTSSDPAYENNAKYYAEHGASNSFAGLTDTDITSPQNGQVPVYNDQTHKWENQDAPSSGLLPHLYIDSEAGSTVTVVAPDSSVITPTQISSGHWECDVPSYGVYTIHSVLNSEDATLSLTVDDVKEYHVTDSHYDYDLSVYAPTGSTIRVTATGETYTGTGAGSTAVVFALHQASTTYTIQVTLDGLVQTDTIVSSSTTGGSGSKTFEFGTINVTVGNDFVGENITCTKGQSTVTKLASTTSLVFSVNETGTWTISGQVSGTTYTVDAVVSSLSTPVSVTLESVPEGSTVTPTDDIQIWLACAEITDKSYTTLAEVLADTDTYQLLLSNSNACDYMARSTTWAGSSEGLVPQMTGYTTPSGEVIYVGPGTGTSGNYPVWKAFDRNSSTDGAIAYNIGNSAGYHFTSPTVVNKIAMASTDSSTTSAFVFEGSNDNNTYTELLEFVGSNRTIKYYEFENETAYSYYRVRLTNKTENWGDFGFQDLQFYKAGIVTNQDTMRLLGKYDYACNKLLSNATWASAIANSDYFEYVLDVSVPKMTSNTTPSGTVLKSREASSFEAYKAFDNNTSTFWIPIRSTTSIVDDFIGYEFTSPVRIKKVNIVGNRFTNAVIQASNDGTTYTSLKEINLGGGDSDFSVDEIIDNDVSYTHYILKFTSASSQVDCHISELQFYGRHASNYQEGKVAIHGARNATLYYKDSGSDITIGQTDSTTGIASVTLANIPTGTYAIYDGVAKDPSNLSNDYSKTVTITSNTTEVYLMPDGYILCWWGYESSDLEDMSTANGWVHNSRSFGTPTRNTKDIQLTCNTTNVVGIACKNQISPTSAHVITNSVTGGTAFCFDASKNMTSTTIYKNITVSGSSLTKTDMTSISNSGYLYIRTATNNYSAKVNALWYE